METPIVEEPSKSPVEPEVRTLKKSKSNFGQVLNFWKDKEAKTEDVAVPAEASLLLGCA